MKRHRKSKYTTDKRRDYNLRRHYGISLDQFEQLLREQELRCAICAVEFFERPHVDHNHATGTVRGLLCSRCNTGIGLFQDDKILLLLAVKYLHGHELRPRTTIDRQGQGQSVVTTGSATRHIPSGGQRSGELYRSPEQGPIGDLDVAEAFEGGVDDRGNSVNGGPIRDSG